FYFHMTLNRTVLVKSQTWRVFPFVFNREYPIVVAYTLPVFIGNDGYAGLQTEVLLVAYLLDGYRSGLQVLPPFHPAFGIED
ncbi:MAG: hypothetical protein AAFW70_30890, partial [Cyanobacteria bacterium J06635_10]